MVANQLPLASASTLQRRQLAAAWRALAIGALAVFMVSLDGTVLFVAFPSIRRTFPDVSASSLSWILNAYTIGYGALLVPMGRLADRFGRRRFFLAGVAVFTAASILCGLAPGVPALIVARSLQAIGAAMLMPASLALVLHAFPKQRRGVAIGVWGAVGALAAAFGPGVGSAIVQFASWRWAFLLNLPIGAYALAAGLRRLPESRADERGSLPDLLGTGLLVVAFGILAYGILAAGAAPARAPWLITAGLVLLGVFVVHSLRVRSPAVDLRLFSKRSFAVANSISLVFSIAFTAMFFGNVFFLTQRWHLPIFQAGLWISPGPLTVIPVAILSGRLADRIGYRGLFVLGGLVFSTGALWLLHNASQEASFLAWLPGSISMGVAIGMVLPSLSGAAATDLAPGSFGVGSGVNQAVRQFGSLLGVAIVIVILGGLGASARFENVFWLLFVSGLLTAMGGVFLGRRAAAPESGRES
jgi:EmrB/QacA subfamily drug resistance transporter